MAVVLQRWGEDLRLPCFTSQEELAPVFKDIEQLRKSFIPFQSKHIPALKRNVWYALKRPTDRTRSGLLYLWPEKTCCVYISGEPITSKSKQKFPRVALLRLRIDPQFFSSGPTIFSATLSPLARRLWIEDVLVWKGRTMSEELFSTRWRLAAQWLEHWCILDARLLGGLEVEMAHWKSLERVQPNGIWEFQADEAGRKRITWSSRYMDPSTITKSPSVINIISAPVLDDRPRVALATRETGPDQWSLTTADNVSLGKALLRTMSISSALRSSKSKTVRLEVTWNSVFQKWEGIALSSNEVSQYAFFKKDSREDGTGEKDKDTLENEEAVPEEQET
jgi:hypothetical protein